MAPRGLQKFKNVTVADLGMQTLIITIKNGCPTSKKACPPKLISYYDCRDFTNIPLFCFGIDPVEHCGDERLKPKIEITASVIQVNFD